MKRAIIIASTALVAGIVSAPASAETLNVQGIVAPYCNVNLANVSSGTASIAMVSTQTVANLRLSCNSSAGTKFVLDTQNGDLLSSANNRINYHLEVASASDSSFNIAPTDTKPGSGMEGLNRFTRSNSGYTQAVANGIPLVMSLNMNVAVDPDNAPGSQNFPANAAPAGTYTEVFTFTASSV